MLLVVKNRKEEEERDRERESACARERERGSATVISTVPSSPAFCGSM